MTRQEAIRQARKAANRAEALASLAERYATHPDLHHKVTPIAEAGSVLADTARAFAAIAQALPETEA